MPSPVVQVRLSADLLKALDKARGKVSRSVYIRSSVEASLQGSGDALVAKASRAGVRSRRAPSGPGSGVLPKVQADAEQARGRGPVIEPSAIPGVKRGSEIAQPAARALRSSAVARKPAIQKRASR